MTTEPHAGAAGFRSVADLCWHTVRAENRFRLALRQATPKMIIIAWRHWPARNALIASLTKPSIVVLDIGGHVATP